MSSKEQRKPRVSSEDYKYGYRRLYGWLRTKYPSILKEYREACLEDKQRAEAVLKQALE